MFLGIGIMSVLCLVFFTKFRIKFGFFEIGPAVQPLRRLHQDDMKALGDCIGGQLNENMKKKMQGGRGGKVPRIATAVVHDEKHGIQDLQSAAYDHPVQDEEFKH